MSEPEQLTDLRKQIDDIDTKLVQLLDERARLALQVGIAKGGQNIHRPEREAEVLNNVIAAGNGTLSADGLQAIFTKIIEVCRTIQYTK